MNCGSFYAKFDSFQRVYSGEITDEQIAQAVVDYMARHPVDGVTEAELAVAIEKYFRENPVEGGTVTDEQIAKAIYDYLNEHPVEVPEVDLTGVVKSVNGKTPDESGNVEITVPDSSQNVELDTTLTQPGQAADAKAVGDALNELRQNSGANVNYTETDPTVFDWAKKELFDKADLPLNTQSFVTVDGVEYYRYHAGATYGFTWLNPKPMPGAVTITARGVSQYGGTGGTRLKTIYDDGTYGPELYIVVSGESRTATATTDPNKTLAKITGNYDMEDWVLLDMSVMSVQSNYFTGLPEATADAHGGVKADPTEETDTQPVRIGKDGKLYTAPGSGSGANGSGLSLISRTEITTDDNVLLIEFEILDEYEEAMMVVYAPWNSVGSCTAITQINGTQIEKDWYDFQHQSTSKFNVFYLRKIGISKYQVFAFGSDVDTRYRKNIMACGIYDAALRGNIQKIGFALSTALTTGSNVSPVVEYYAR